MMNSLENTGCFITGTDTDVGKTIVTAALYRAALQTTRKIVVLKAVQTGVAGPDAPESDVRVYRKATEDLDPEIPPTALHCFSTPCSPHLAAKRDGQSIDFTLLVSRIRDYRERGYFTIVEGAGGLFVPLDEDTTMLDLMRELRFPVLLVFDNRIGCINHALLSLRELERNGLDVWGTISNRTKNEGFDDEIHVDNVECIIRRSGIPVWADVPFYPDRNSIETWNSLAEIMRPAWTELSGIRKKGSESTDELLRFDREHLWHPYTSSIDPHPVVPVSKACGAVLTTKNGDELVDGMASWWCAIHGYAHPKLDAAVSRQLGRMSHVMFGGITHRPAVELGKRILDMVPGTLNRIFFADSGSVSVEVAMKMAVQFRQAGGETQRNRFMTFRGGYHGDTTGAMSVCDPVNGMHTLFQGVLSRQIFLDRPRIPFDGNTDCPDFREEIQNIENAFERHADETTAFILEPIVQGAGGMWFYHPDYLRIVRRLCDRYDILLIVDEIATGFGRTGTLFASQWADVEADILCIGKALSGGYMTLAATLATEEVANRISSGGNVFMHGPTFMANPLACAVAGASLDLIATGNWRNDIARIENGLRKGLAPCRTNPDVADVRILGGIGVVEMNDSVNTRRLQRFFLRQGVWIRPFGKLIYLMPPYCVDENQLERLTQSIVAALDDMEYLG